MAIYDLGDSVVFSVIITDADGAATTPLTISLTITEPDGTTTTPTPTNVDTGTYSYIVIPDQAGQYTASWSSTTPDAAYTEIANVRPATERMLISLDEARRHLNLVSTDHDEELRETILVASAMIEDFIGPVLPQTVTERTTAYGWYVPLDRPIVGVTTVASGGTVAAADGSNRGYRIEGRALRLYSGETPVRWGGDVAVTYRAGVGETVPPTVRQATRELLRHLWDTQRGPNAPRYGESDYVPGSSYALPRRVVELLGSYATPGVA